MTQILKRWVPLGLWLAACAGAMAALWSVEEPRFDLPPTNPGAWSHWASGRDQLDAAAGVSRLLATLALSYLLVVSVAHLLALAWGPEGLRRVTARLSPGPIAALAATAVLGGSPLAAAIGPPGAPGAGDGSGETPAPVMRVIEDDPPQTTTAVPRTPAPRANTSRHATTEPNPGGGTIPRAAPTPVPAPAPVPSPTPLPSSENAAAMHYSVVPGDNLWVIAQRRVHLDLGRDGTEAEIRGYWLALIELNAPRMAEPGNPNLLLPGQQLQLPG